MDDRIASVACPVRVAQRVNGPPGQITVATIEAGSSAPAAQPITSPAATQKTVEYRPFDPARQHVDHAANQLFRQHRKVTRFESHLLESRVNVNEMYALGVHDNLDPETPGLTRSTIRIAFVNQHVHVKL